MNRDHARVRCRDCRYHHPRFCGYTKLREEGKGNTVSEDCWHGCQDFSPGRPPELDRQPLRRTFPCTL